MAQSTQIPTLDSESAPGRRSFLWLLCGHDHSVGLTRQAVREQREPACHSHPVTER